MIRLCSIAPVVETRRHTLADYQGYLDTAFAGMDGATVTGTLIATGPETVENELDDALAVPGVVKAGMAAVANGAQGVLIDCMLDPGLAALRCAVDVPVMGAAEIGFRLAATLGHRFGIVDVCDDTGPMVTEQVRAMGLADRFAGVRGTGLGVAEIEADATRTLLCLEETSRQLVLEDGADILVFGCTQFSSFAASLRDRLALDGINVPVVNPVVLAMGTLLAVVRADLAHSKRAYPFPSSGKQSAGLDLPPYYGPVS